jgi:hypothetical protein
MKLWIDDTRPAPEGYVWIKAVYGAKREIEHCEKMKRFFPKKTDWDIEVIDIDHDAGFYAQFGGDYIRLLDWLEETGRNYPIRIHSMNVVGVQNMRAIIERNGWQEIKS